MSDTKPFEETHNFCGYCNKTFEAGEEGWRQIKLHIGGCEKHPVYQLDVANTRLRNELARLKEFVSKQWSADFHEPDANWLKGWRDACMSIYNEFKK